MTELRPALSVISTRIYQVTFPMSLAKIDELGWAGFIEFYGFLWVLGLTSDEIEWVRCEPLSRYPILLATFRVRRP